MKDVQLEIIRDVNQQMRDEQDQLIHDYNMGNEDIPIEIDHTESLVFTPLPPEIVQYFRAMLLGKNLNEITHWMPMPKPPEES